jgi:hypothetical protein
MKNKTKCKILKITYDIVSSVNMFNATQTHPSNMQYTLNNISKIYIIFYFMQASHITYLTWLVAS